MNDPSQEEYRLLATLSRKLADRQLTEWFPEQEPQAVRSQLKKMASRVQPPAKATPQGLPFAAQPKTKAEPAPGAGHHLVLFTDGASRGNPGKAGAGIQVMDQQGQELLTDCKFLGHATNNEAEYQALILGLTRVKELGAAKVDIFLDSELIVRQIQGRYKVKNAGLKPLYGQVVNLLSSFEAYKVGHVPRAQNKRADEMANQGIDRQK